MKRVACFSASLILGIAVVAGCASGRTGTTKGESGPIVWEVVDLRQTVEERGNRLRWNYTLALKNVGSTAVAFDQMTLVSMAQSGNLSGGHSTRSFSRRLEPGAELREANNSYSHGCVQNCDPGWVQQMLREGVNRNIEVRGTDASGRPVVVLMRIPLNSSVGMRVTPIREIRHIAGKWRGAIFGASSGPVTIAIEPDGQYAWTGQRESGTGTLRTGDDGRARFESSAGRRGSVTLYAGEGRRLMAIDFEGVDWKGELTPAE